jgi:hypothetical protein
MTFKKVKWMPVLAVVAIVTSGIAMATGSAPAGKPSKEGGATEVESILDRLEKKLIDNEGGGLTFGEKMEPASGDHSIPKPGTTMKFTRDGAAGEAKGAAGQTDEDPGVAMKGLAEAVAGLEVQVERLHADVQKARLKVIEDARYDNFVQIDAEFRGMDKATLKSLTVKIDGVEVYRASDAGGLWVPSSKLPLFSGPVPPGAHKLYVEAAVLVREGPNVPVSADITRRMDKEFEFSVPDGKDRKSIGITIDAPPRPGSKGNITMTGGNGDGVNL